MKKIIVWILAIVVVIVLFFLVFSYPGRMLISDWFSFSDCGNEFNVAFNEALKNNDINFCLNQVGDIKWGKDVGYGISCNLREIKFGIRKNDFQDSCLAAMAYSTKNVEFCRLINGEGYKGSCVLDIARNKKDVSYCEILDKTNAYYSVCIKE